MKILYLIDSLGYGGAEKLLTLYLKYLDREKFSPRVCVFSSRDGNPLASEIKKLGIQVDVLPVSNMRDLSALPRLVSYIRKNEYDLLHTQLSFSNTLGPLAGSISRVPSVSTLHTHKDPQRGTTTYWRFILMGVSLRLFSDRIISVSDATRTYNNQKLKLPDKKSITLFNGIELDTLPAPGTEEQREIRDMLGISQSAIVLITIAVLRKEKGIQFLLHAMPEIIKRVPEAIYLVVGDGEYRAELSRLIEQLGISKNVKLTGYREDIHNYLSISDLFVLPSFTEALPTVIAEAMRFGLPIIASNVGGIPEMIQHKVNGLIVTPKDTEALTQSIVHLLVEDVEGAKKYGKAGEEFVHKNFNISRQIRSLEDIYLQVTTERN